jgi:hypothetical protein
LPWEEPLLIDAAKIIMPSDVISNPEKYKGMQIHWVGIVDSFEIVKENDKVVQFFIDHKYYDYIEDFSIQREKIFLSPKGEGKFIFLQSFPNSPLDSLKIFCKEMTKRKDLAFCYGEFNRIENGLPLLHGIRARFIHEQFYSTKIWSYDIQRDAGGNVIPDGRGFPSIGKVDILKIPGPGKND